MMVLLIAHMKPEQRFEAPHNLPVGALKKRLMKTQILLFVPTRPRTQEHVVNLSRSIKPNVQWDIYSEHRSPYCFFFIYIFSPLKLGFKKIHFEFEDCCKKRAPLRTNFLVNAYELST